VRALAEGMSLLPHPIPGRVETRFVCAYSRVSFKVRWPSMPSVSVILPNRNHAHHLPRAFAALAAQTRRAEEIVLVDDASTDESAAVAQSWRDRLPELRIIRLPEQLGVVGALNTGLRAARGTLIYAAAADDVARPRLFEAARAAFSAHPEAGVFTGEALVIDGDSGALAIRPAVAPLTTQYLDPARFRRWLSHSDNLCIGVCCLVRRDRMMAEGGYDPALGPYCDSFVVRRICLTDGVVFTPEVLGEWHRSAEGVSQSITRDPAQNLACITEGRRRIETDAARVYPPGYGDLFMRRAMFNAARTAMPDAALVARLSHLPERRLARLLALPGIGRVAAMAALTLSLRPVSLPRLLLTQGAYWLRSRTDPARLNVLGTTS